LFKEFRIGGILYVKFNHLVISNGLL
jgi:hypothetical protein